MNNLPTAGGLRQELEQHGGGGAVVGASALRGLNRVREAAQPLAQAARH